MTEEDALLLLDNDDKLPLPAPANPEETPAVLNGSKKKRVDIGIGSNALTITHRVQ